MLRHSRSKSLTDDFIFAAPNMKDQLIDTKIIDTKIIDNKPTYKKTDFSKINILNCSIRSLKNQLKSASSIDELTVITSKILDLEQCIADERIAGYQKLNRLRISLETKIDGLSDRSKPLEYELSCVTLALVHKLNTYRSILDKKITNLSCEYADLTKNLTSH